MRGLAAIFHFLFACVCTNAQMAQDALHVGQKVHVSTEAAV